jgi:hypothetical protein
MVSQESKLVLGQIRIHLKNMYSHLNMLSNARDESEFSKHVSTLLSSVFNDKMKIFSKINLLTDIEVKRFRTLANTLEENDQTLHVLLTNFQKKQLSFCDFKKQIILSKNILEALIVSFNKEFETELE